MSTLRSIVLCGGSGTRLWPLSRALYPKQFMDLGGHTLFGDTVDRAAALPDSADPLVVCNEEHRFYVAAALQQKGVSGTILLEPKGRNTAPAIALAAFAALSGGGDPLLLVLPSDHVLKPQDVFAEAVARARACAESGRIVTFGITPDAPETGFGYIRRGGALPSGGYAVARFVEKPDLARAEAMLADGGYLWNSGMFLFRASIYLEELALHAPGIHAACRAAWEGHHADRDFIRPDADAFLSSPADSIDYAVMEKTDRAAVVPLTADWSDLGSWEAFYEAAPHDGDGNVRVGDVYAEGAENCYLHASNRMVAALGVSDLVVVETADSVLVADRARTQDVKKIVESLKKEARTKRLPRHLPRRNRRTRRARTGNGFRSQGVKRLSLRRLAVLPIRLYQWTLSPVLPPSCRYHPTCSAYAIEAVLTHGIFKGSWLALRRILRCHPWSSGGYDPVPPPHSSSFSHQEQLDHHGR